MVVALFLAVPASAGDRLIDAHPEAAASGCMKCHAGIELIREAGSEMLGSILERGAALGDPAGCVVCHGGDPAATDKAAAHAAAGGNDPHGAPGFYPDPGSPWINDRTCGQCHPRRVDVQWRSLMMTEAGKIQGVCWAFGSMTGYDHPYANYAVENPKDRSARLGTDDYRAYMEALTAKEPQVFVERHLPLPDAPVDPSKLKDDPTPAAFTYIRQECNRCHHAVKGRQVRGDYRGMGCSSCHVPYSNEGFYEGGDPTIDKEAVGHMLVHSFQGTREAKVTVHENLYSGIPVETCTTCHDRGKRIGVSFQSLMETPYESPFAADGSGQPALHTKHYIAMSQDVHYQKGMTCQDCHTSLDVHGDGFLAAANLASVQIECADCHGTPDRFPWELPLGFMDEYEPAPAAGPARGVTSVPNPLTLQGTVYDPRGGYLLTARGNPYENVVRVDDEVIAHTAAGKDLKLKPLKLLEQTNKLSAEGRVAMLGVTKHLDRMECYTCHASWTPQCYGCHVKIDYSRAAECPECDAEGGAEKFSALKATLGKGEAEPKDANVDSNDAAEIAAVRAEVAALGRNAGFDWIAAGRRPQARRTGARRGPGRERLRLVDPRQGDGAAVLYALGRPGPRGQRRGSRHPAGAGLPALPHDHRPGRRADPVEPHLQDDEGLRGRRRGREPSDRP